MEIERILGLVSIGLLASGLLLLAGRWPLGIHQTFSAHAAQSKKLSAYYFFIFAVTLPLFYVYLYGWVVPTLGASVWAAYIFLFVILTQIACTFFPETGSSTKVVAHRALAGISALLLVPVLVLLALSVGGLAHYSIVTGLVVMLTSLLLGVIGRGRYALILQASYCLAFFVPVLVLGYLK